MAAVSFPCEYAAYRQINQAAKVPSVSWQCMVCFIDKESSGTHHWIFCSISVMNIVCSQNRADWLWHTLITWHLATKQTLVCHTTMHRNFINFPCNPGHVTPLCLEVVLVANAREGSTQEHNWARVWPWWREWLTNVVNDRLNSLLCLRALPIEFATRWTPSG